MNPSSWIGIIRRRPPATKLVLALTVVAGILGAGLLTERLGIVPLARSPLVRAKWPAVQPEARPKALATGRHDPGLVPSPVIINEVMTENPETILDEDLAPSDWVELYNRSDAPVDLTRWALAQGRRTRHRWVFPKVVLPPGGFLVVWASGKDRVGSAASRFTVITLDPGALGHRRFDGAHRPEHPLWYREGEAPRFRSMDVELDLPEEGRYALWFRIRDLTPGQSRLRVTMDGVRAGRVPGSAGGPYMSVRVGPRSGQGPDWALGPGRHVVRVVATGGLSQIERVTLTGAKGVEDPYGLHLHASFRLRKTGEAVTLLDPAGAVRDEVRPTDHRPGWSLQRAPGGGPWAGLGPPTPGGRLIHAPPDLGAWPSLSATPFSLEPRAPAGVEELRYTLDGSVPGRGAPRLVRPVEMTQPTVLRLRGFTGGQPSTAVVTRQFWVGSLPERPVVMVALDPSLVVHPERGIMPNNQWRMRPRHLPPPPALRALRRARDREWLGWRRGSTKVSHALIVDRTGVLLDGKVQIRSQAGPEPVGGFHLDGGPIRDLFGPNLQPSPLRVLIDHSGRDAFLNQWAYEMIRASGGVAPRARPALFLVNGRSPREAGIVDGEAVVSLVETVNRDFLQARWHHDDFDLLKGRPLRVLRGSIAAFQALADRIARDDWDAAAIRDAVDLPGLIALHFGLVFIEVTGFGIEEGVQGYMALDRTTRPARLHAIGWDMDQSMRPSRADQDTLAVLSQRLRGLETRSRFLPEIIAIKLLERDAAFREQYLRHAEWAMNHVFTADRWADRWAEGGRDDVLEATRNQIVDFLRKRPAHVRAALVRAFALPQPRSVRVEIEGRGGALIDGHEYRETYEGRYFAGGSVGIVIPERSRGTFRHFRVGGDIVAGPVLWLPVTGDLSVQAIFAP